MDVTGEHNYKAAPVRSDAIDPARFARKCAAAVFLLTSALFLALMSGHIYARDEETLYQMTDGIALRGQPLVSPLVWGIVDSTAPSKHGLRPTSYAPGQPLVAVPWYWLGRALSGLAAPEYAAYLTRFVILSFNVFVTAAVAALLCRFALVLGYRARSGIALAFCYSGATFAMIQARTFFAEPLTALLVLLAFFLIQQACHRDASNRLRPRMLAASGFVLGCALFVKIHAALFFPVLALYLTMETIPSFRRFPAWLQWRALLVRAAWWLAGLALPLAALLLYNRWLYGSPFSTGYGDTLNVYTTPLATGLYGLLLSSGKGIIWYAPPLIFGLIGLPRFLRRFPRIGSAILGAAAVNFIFYARLAIWSGDGAWGPRYLLIVLPWLLLPALPTCEYLLAPGRRGVKVAARVAGLLVILAGIVVQLLAVAVSFDVPLLTNPNDHARYFSPSQSPIVLSYHVARSRIGTWWADRQPPANSFVLATGFDPPEADLTDHFPRWTNGNATITLNPPTNTALHLKITYFDHRPPAMRATATAVTVALGNEAIVPVDRLAIAPANEGFILAYDIPPALLHSAGRRLTIVTPTWNPSRAGVSDRDEELGIFLNNLEIWADGVPISPQEAKRFPTRTCHAAPGVALGELPKLPAFARLVARAAP